ncbi:DUF4249 domain-containing protein [Niastella caeni]|uniref:DUF4249 domain-containing protein n=1 Tax=Niastella caeni TaxID=2569763 RepID=A0A4S8HNB5_9BACT|nr:DUF4249 family protein [Niastella caeni]THU35949.1 DUF4249 domain-containing protein [Niastella caeni]
MIPRTRLVAILLGLIFTSCEKTITFKPNESEPVLVVEATIENDRAPVVILSQTLNYFNKISPELLAGSFISNAEVTISNGTKTSRLQEKKMPLAAGYTLYYYSTDSSNLSAAVVGELGKTYTLTIKANEKEYTATTTIPVIAKKIDSLWWTDAPNNPNPDKVVLMGRFVDPPGLGNYTRYFTQVQGWHFFPGFNSVMDDQLTDGITYNMQIERGVDRNNSFNLEEYPFFNRGDSIAVKYCNIDKATFHFWRTMEYSYSNIGNPFASPNKVISNIQGGGLGYFGGYAVQYKTIVIPK